MDTCPPLVLTVAPVRAGSARPRGQPPFTYIMTTWISSNASGNWLGWAMAPWEWVTGGSISMTIAGILILVSWAKYRTAIYPIFIGVVMLPLSYFLFPAEFLSFAFLLAALGVGITSGGRSLGRQIDRRARGRRDAHVIRPVEAVAG